MSINKQPVLGNSGRTVSSSSPTSCSDASVVDVSENYVETLIFLSEAVRTEDLHGPGKEEASSKFIFVL